MIYAVTVPMYVAHTVRNVEQVLPVNVRGRYVYASLTNGGDIYVRELEVFAPFTYGQ